MKRALILSGGGSRGSFQVGVWRYLKENNWLPDIICGSSIGAINAVAIGSGLTVEQITNIWTKSVYRSDKIYRLQLFDFIANALFRRRWKALMDTKPLRDTLKSTINFKKLKQSRTEIIISAVNLHTATPEFFTQNEITIDHVMASSAMPIIFSPHKIDGIPYWDGGIMANIPLLPALARGAEEIIVVLLSPVGHLPKLPEPESIMDAGEQMLEQFLISSYHSTLMAQLLNNKSLAAELLCGSPFLRKKNEWKLSDNLIDRTLDSQKQKRPRIITIAPSKMLGIPSLLNFTLKQAETLMIDGYNSARNQLKEIL